MIIKRCSDNNTSLLPHWASFLLIRWITIQSIIIRIEEQAETPKSRQLKVLIGILTYMFSIRLVLSGAKITEDQYSWRKNSNKGIVREAKLQN